jgi:hypothetical protein
VPRVRKTDVPVVGGSVLKLIRQESPKHQMLFRFWAWVFTEAMNEMENIKRYFSIRKRGGLLPLII